VISQFIVVNLLQIAISGASYLKLKLVGSQKLNLIVKEKNYSQISANATRSRIFNFALWENT